MPTPSVKVALQESGLGKRCWRCPSIARAGSCTKYSSMLSRNWKTHDTISVQDQLGKRSVWRTYTCIYICIFMYIQYRSYVLGHPGFFSNHCRNTRSFIQKIRRSRTSVCTSNNLLPLLFFRRTNVASFVATVWRYKSSTVTLSIYSAF